MKRFAMPLAAAALGIGIAVTAAAPVRAQFLGLTVPAPDYHTIDWCSWETITESQAQEVYDQYFGTTRALSQAIRDHKLAIGRLTDGGVLGALGALAIARVIGGEEAMMQGVAYELGDRLPKLLKYTVTLTRLRQHYRIQRRILDCMEERLEAFAVDREKRKKFGGKVPGWLPGALDRMAKVKRELGENKNRLDEIRIGVTPEGRPMIFSPIAVIPMVGDVTGVTGLPLKRDDSFKPNLNESWHVVRVTGKTISIVPIRTNDRGEIYIPKDWNEPETNPPGDAQFVRTYPVGDLVAPPQTAKVPGGGGKDLNDRGQLNQPTAGAKDGDLSISLSGGQEFRFGGEFSPARGTNQNFTGDVTLTDMQLQVLLRVPDIGTNTRIGLKGGFARGHDTEREGDLAGGFTITSITGLNTQNIAGVKDATLETDHRRWNAGLTATTELPQFATPRLKVELTGGIVYENERIDQHFRQFVTGNGVNFFLHGLDSEIRSQFIGGTVGFRARHRLPGKWHLSWGADVAAGSMSSDLSLVQLPGTFGGATVRREDSASSFSVRTLATVAIHHDIFDNVRIGGRVSGGIRTGQPFVDNLDTPGVAPTLGFRTLQTMAARFEVTILLGGLLDAP